MKVLNPITRILGYFIAILSVAAIPLFYISSYDTELGLITRGVGKLLGNLGLIFGFTALGIWVSRKVFAIIKEKQWKDFGVFRQLSIFLRKHHILIG
ncbi:hypothetical protein [Tepidibacillus marianensis]|uniref:hypothetical protein n=1 Tax=Tepidibacillus marianensis TaxID=3131995 RepID=UPI0030D371E5